MNSSNWKRQSLNLLAAVSVASMLAACGGGSDDSTASSDPTLVVTDKGTVQGVERGSVITFLGIPYAAAPTGALRFKAPQPREPWTTTLQAKAPGNDCPQIPRGATTMIGNEDCLYLNVTVPKTSTAKKPVLVMLHGGRLLFGRGASYDGSWLAAAGDVITVSVNYRLGILGFLAHDALESAAGDSGMYAVQDQQAALKWVRRNIAQFGGDPDNVTLGGLSAGAMSTCFHLVAPESQGLFVRGIVESGPCAFNWATIQEKKTAEASLPKQLGCSGSNAEIAACLRSSSLDVANLMTVQNTVANVLGAGSAFSVGGTVAPVQTRTGLGKVPLLLGFMMVERGNQPLADPTEAGYLSALQGIYGATNASFVKDQYPSSGSYLAGVTAYSQALSDYNPTPGLAEIAACLNVRSYQLTREAGGTIFGWEFGDVAAGNITHTMNEQYLYPLFSDTFPPAGKALSAPSQALSDVMVKYWANFIRNGNPNGTGLPAWPAFTSPTDVMQLRPGAIGTGTDVDSEHKCAFWRSIGYAL